MGAGVFVGVFWGLVLSALVVTVVSLSAPLPPRSDQAAGAPVEPAPEPAAETASGEVVPDAEPVEPAQTAQPETPQAVDTASDDAADSEAGAAPSVPAAVAALEGAQPGPSLDPQSGAALEGIPLPAGSEFNRPPPEEAPVLPGTDDALAVRSPSAPEVSVPPTPGGVDTAPAPQPDIAVAPEPSDPGVLDTDDVALPATGGDAPDARTALQPAPLAQLEPDASAEADAQSVAPPAPEPPAPEPPAPDPAAPEPAVPEPAEVPDVAGAPDDDQARDPEPDAIAEAPGAAAEPSEAPSDRAEAAPRAAEPETASPAPARPPAVVQLVPPQESAPLALVPLDELPVPGETAAVEMPEPPRVLRPSDTDDAPTVERTLPQIVSPARNLPETDDGEATSDMPVARVDGDMVRPPEADAAEQPAIEAYAAPFDAAETRPLIAVILIDEPDERLDIETLTRFTFPVAFAIDPSRPDAAERAAIYRDAGFEVLMLASVIPEGATATDTEVALAAARARVPEAIALMDTPEARVQSERVVLEAAVGAAAGEGQGFVAFPRGLNTAEQTAARADVPAATLFRLLDDEDQRATVITRYLGRAEFAAQQEGAVVVAGRTRPDTVTALFSWALGDRNEGVAIAPVSAVLQRLAQDR